MAAILNKTHVLYEPEITEFYQYELIRPYMEKNPAFITLDKLTQEQATALANDNNNNNNNAKT